MKNIKLKCNSLNTLIETIQSLILKENVSVLKSPLLEANGEFTSVVQTKDDFDPSQISSNVFADEEKNEEPPMGHKFFSILPPEEEQPTEEPKEKDQEIKLLTHQLNSLRKIIKHGTVDPLETEVTKYIEKIKMENK